MNTTTTNQKEQDMTTTEIPNRYGFNMFTEVSADDAGQYVKRSSKKALAAAANNGWRVEYSINESSGSFMLHCFPKAPKAWAALEDTLLPHSRRQKFVVPARVDLAFDGETGAFYSASLELTDHDSRSYYRTSSFLGSTLTEAVTFLEWPERKLKQIADRRRQEQAQQVETAKRSLAREAYFDQLRKGFVLSKLERYAGQEPQAPQLDETMSVHRIMSEATSYAVDLTIRSIAQRALDVVGWPNAHGEPITIGQAVQLSIGEHLGRSFNTPEVLVKAASKMSNEYWEDYAS